MAWGDYKYILDRGPGCKNIENISDTYPSHVVLLAYGYKWSHDVKYV